MSSKNRFKSPNFSRERKIGKRRDYNRRVIFEHEVREGEIYLHATKGWRARREHSFGNNIAGDLLRSFFQ